MVCLHFGNSHYNTGNCINKDDWPGVASPELVFAGAGRRDEIAAGLPVDDWRRLTQPRSARCVFRGPSIFVTPEARPGDVLREALIARAFRAKTFNGSHRARLRAEIGRLRSDLGAVAGVCATKHGFELVSKDASEVAVLAQPIEGKYGELLALLADGESWPT